MTAPVYYLSDTQKQMFGRCPKQYAFRYVMGVKKPPAGPVVCGRWGHETMERNLQKKKDEGEELELQEFCGDWETRFDQGLRQEEINWEGKDPNDFRTAFLGSKLTFSMHVPGGVTQRKKGLLPIVRTNFTPTLDPILVEHEVQIEIPKGEKDREGWIHVIGKIDCVSKAGRKQTCRDFKFTSRDGDTAEDSDQLTIYALALKAEGVKVSEFAIDNLVHGTQVPKVSTHTTKRGEDRLEAIIQEYREIAKQIEHLGDDPERYPMTRRDAWWCSEKFCGFASMCPRYGGNYK